MKLHKYCKVTKEMQKKFIINLMTGMLERPWFDCWLGHQLSWQVFYSSTRQVLGYQV